MNLVGGGERDRKNLTRPDIQNARCDRGVGKGAWDGRSGIELRRVERRAIADIGGVRPCDGGSRLGHAEDRERQGAARDANVVEGVGQLDPECEGSGVERTGQLGTT